MPFTPFSLDVTNGKATKQNLDAEVNRVVSEVEAQIASAALGIQIVETVAEMETFYSDPDNHGRLVMVTNEGGDADDPANGIYEYVDGEPRKSSLFVDTNKNNYARAVQTFAQREAIPVYQRQYGLHVYVVEGARWFRWDQGVDEGADGWTGLMTQAELINRAMQTGTQNQDTINGLPEALSGLNTVDNNLIAATKQNADLKIGSFTVSALSPTGPWQARWNLTGAAPNKQVLSWDGYSVELPSGTNEYLIADQSEVTGLGIIGNSLSDSTGASDRWSQVLASSLGVDMVSVARSTSDARQKYRLGAAPLELTIAGGTLPATGGSPAEISLINGIAPSADAYTNPASFLNTNTSSTDGMTMLGQTEFGPVSVSISNGNATDYKIVQTRPGAGTVSVSAPVKFVPEFAVKFSGRTVIIWPGNNYFYSGVPNDYGDYTNPQMWVDLEQIVNFLRARGCRIIMLPIIPSADWAVTGAGNPYDAMEAANARTASRYPDYWAGDLLAELQANGDGSANDNADISAGFVPRSLRYDPVHLNSAGDAIVAQFVEDFLPAQQLPPAPTTATTFTLFVDGDDGLGGSMQDTATTGLQDDPLASVVDELRNSVTYGLPFKTFAEAEAELSVGDRFQNNSDGVATVYEVTSLSPFAYDDLGPLVTAAGVGLGNVDNTSDADKPVSVAVRAAIDQRVPEPRTISGNGPGTIANAYASPNEHITINTDNGFVRLYLPAEGGTVTVSAVGGMATSLNGNGRSLSGVLASGIVLPGGAPLQVSSDDTRWFVVDTDLRAVTGLTSSLAAADLRNHATRRTVAIATHRSAARRALFATTAVYRLAGAVATRADVVDDGSGNAPATNSAGELLIERATTNLVTNPAFATGFTVGVVGSGGTIGTPWQNTGSGNLEVKSVSSGRLQLRCFSATSPTGTNQGLHTAWFAKGVLTRGGYVASALLKLISATGPFSRAYVGLQSRNSSTGTQGSTSAGNDIRTVLTEDTLSSAFLGSIPEDHDQVRIRIIVLLTSAAPYDVTLEIFQPQVEDGSSALDYTSFVNGSRSSVARALMPEVDHDVVYGGTGGYSWVLGNGPTVLVSPVGTIKAKNLAAIERAGVAMTAQEKSDFVAANFPAVLGAGVPHDAAITFAGRRWRTENPDKTYSLRMATNRQAYAAFEVHDGDTAPFETGRNRSEIKLLPGETDQIIPFDTDFWVSGYVAIQFDQPSPANIPTVMWQAHNTQDEGESSQSPSLALRLQGEDLFLTIQGDTNPITTSSIQNRVWMLPGVVRTGLSDAPYFHRYVVRARFTRDGTSQLDFWWNGEKVYSGTGLLMGYNDIIGHYWKTGLYRSTESSETLRIIHANPELGQSTLFDRVANPLPIG